MIATFFFLQHLSHVEDIHPNKPLSNFPKQIGEWTGQEDHFEDSIYTALGVDDSFYCHYRTPDGRYVQLYIGFHQSQTEGDLIHSPKNCMPGGGWNITQTDLVEIPMQNDGNKKNKVIKMNLENGPNKQIVLYWYQSRGRVIHSEYTEKIYLVIDSITRNRTDGTFIRLIAPVTDNNEEMALKDLKQFAEMLFPILDEFIPS